MSDTMIAHRPAVLKEGYLYKPAFFRLGGRKRRWCVLRAFSQSEPACIDIYTDDTRTEFKRSIPLEKNLNPIVVKNSDVSSGKKKSAKHSYFALKVGKTVHHFTTDSWRELEEWCALIRQAMDSGQTFSGRVTEPSDFCKIAGTVNVRFQSNCMTLRCPIKELPLKTWRLDTITSFGQCGEILTFECCPQCSEAGSNCRASIHILRENPVTFLNVMERAIRSSQANSEIHYERSMLGDIYHCRHDCGRGRGSVSPIKMAAANPAIDAHSDTAYMKAIESSDSGLPGTPQTEETLSIASGIPSPTCNNKYSQAKLCCASIKPPYSRDRSISDTQVLLNDSADRLQNRRSDDSYMEFEDKIIRPMYAKISPSIEPKTARNEVGITGKGAINYASVEVVSPKRQPLYCNSRTKLPKEDPLYDEPSSDTLNPSTIMPRTRLGSYEHRDVNSKGSYFAPPLPRSTVDTGDDSEGDYFDIGPPPVPVHKKPLKCQAKEQFNAADHAGLRGRLHSSSDVLERGASSSQTDDKGIELDRHLLGRVNSTDQLHDRELKGSSDLLARLHEEERKLTSILEHTRRTSKVPTAPITVGNGTAAPSVFSPKRAGDYKNPFFTLKEQDYDEPDLDSDVVDETRSNLAEYSTSNVYSSPQTAEKLLSKVPTTTARGYAYKITIPITKSKADIMYDVPRRAAAVPDLGKVPGDAPPKPRRYISTEQLCAK
ncbi:hypothetical protein EMCRGX_G025935 [Ephydatia muelleri]